MKCMIPLFFLTMPLVLPAQNSDRIFLRDLSFNPLERVPEPVFQHQPQEEPGVYLVQFHEKIGKAHRMLIHQLNGEILHYMPQRALVVKISPEARDLLASEDVVRWVGLHQPSWRMDPLVRARVRQPTDVFQRYVIQVFKPEEKAWTAHRLTAVNARVVSSSSGKHLLEAWLTPAQLMMAATWDEVAFIEPWSPMTADMDLVRIVSGANYIEQEDGYTGAGVRGEVFDLGFNQSHMDFASRPLMEHSPVNPGSHGAASAGVIFGDGAGNPEARGLMPDGQGIVAEWGQIGNRYDHVGELLEAPYRAVFHTSSVGSTHTLAYTALSADIDAMFFDHDLIHCQSQGNTGVVNSRPQAWAKNNVAVGGIQHMQTADPSDDCWCGAASIGPAADGRVKPDLSHFNDGVFTVTGGGPSAYAQYTGTSAATPLVCGLFGLFHEMWADGLFGNPVVEGADVFDNRPHAATARAMMINTATPYPFAGPDHDLTRTHQGWGVPDLRQLYDWRQQLLVVDETEILTLSQEKTWSVQVGQGAPQLRATLVYADPPGNPAASVARINDLNLRLTSPSNVIYWGNNGLMAGNESQPDGVPDTVNTVENVWLTSPEPGLWEVAVIAEEINMDGHLETPEVDADFALVVSGVDFSPTLSVLIGLWPLESTILDMVPLVTSSRAPIQ